MVRSAHLDIDFVDVFAIALQVVLATCFSEYTLVKFEPIVNSLSIVGELHVVVCAGYLELSTSKFIVQQASSIWVALNDFWAGKHRWPVHRGLLQTAMILHPLRQILHILLSKSQNPTLTLIIYIIN